MRTFQLMFYNILETYGFTIIKTIPNHIMTRPKSYMKKTFGTRSRVFFDVNLLKHKIYILNSIDAASYS